MPGSPSRWSGFVVWANRLDAPRPLPRLADLARVPELEDAVTATPGARETFERLSESDQVRLTLFVRSAWGGWGRRRRAVVVARECAGGPAQVAEWQASNRAVTAASSFGMNGQRPGQ
jgi:hypothetical protein